MSKIRLVVAGMLVAGGVAFAGPAMAQDEDAAPRAWGTAHGGPVFFTGSFGEGLMDFGAGGEVVWPNGVGFSMDFSILGTIERSDFVVLVSPAVLYEFPTKGKLRPYLRGGITLINFYLPHPMGDIGGGVNYWLSERFGLKGEIRHHLWFEEPPIGLTSFRAGVVFRFK